MIIHAAAARKLFFSAAIALLALTSASACELSFKLVDSSGASRRILPGATIALKAGSSYVLSVEFVEDHRNCSVPPEDTFFLIGDADWAAGRKDQGLVLAKSVEWIEEGRTVNRADIAFTAAKAGTYDLGIFRDCPKGGYDETITFTVK
jgi:hypothetical protein